MENTNETYLKYLSFLPMIKGIIHKLYVPTQIDKRDLEAIATITFLKCLKKYKLNNRSKFITYLYKSIYNNIISYIEKYQYIVSIPKYSKNRKDKLLSNYNLTSISLDRINYINKENLLIEYNNYSNLEINLLLQDITPNQRDIFLKRAWLGWTFEEIAQQKKVKKQSVYESYQRVLKSLRTRYDAPLGSKIISILPKSTPDKVDRSRYNSNAGIKCETQSIIV